MKSKWVIGNGDYLELAFQAWKEAQPDESVEKIVVPQRFDYTFDLQALENLPAAQGTVFAAFGEHFGNFKRMELMQAALERGFKLESFISPAAMVAPSAVIGPNAFIGAGVYVGAGARIDYNTVVHAGARVGAGARLRASCWLDMGVIVGDGADIGAHSTLRMGAMVAGKTKIGRMCELGWPRLYDKDLPSRTIFDTRFDEPIFVYGA